MKKILSVLGALALLFVGFLFTSCDGLIDGDEINNYATTTVDSVSFTTAKAGPGVNVLKWNAVNDVSTYTVYRKVSGGHVEEVVRTASSNLYFIDKNIEAGKSYTYRVVANPTNDNVRDASSKSVTLSTGTWPAEGTTFDALEGGTTNGLASDKITVKLYPTSTGNSVRASFPVKPYASYTVYLSQVNGGLVNNSESRDDSKTVYGYDFDGTATVDLTALYAGEKQVTVVATPLNTTLYGRSVHVAAATVEVLALDDISSAVSGSVSASWTNYNSSTKIATARVWFTPASFNDEEFATTEYTIYRALYTSDGETVAIDESTSTRVYTSITALGNPVKDTTVDSSDDTVYYLDDSGIDLSYANDIAGVRYYVVLNHNGKFKTKTSVLTIPSSSDGDWNFVPDTDSSTTVTNNIAIYDIYIGSDGVFYLKADKDYAYGSELSVTYGTFDTLNEALTAVNSELPTVLTDATESSYYPVYTGVKVDTDKYYAFRVLSTKTGAAVDVVTTVAQPVAVEDGYYWDIKTNRPSNYAAVSTPSVYVTKEFNATNYTSVTLSYYTSNAVFYNIYRGSTLLTTTTADEYTDTSDALKAISVEDTVYYTVDAVSYYNAESRTVAVSALAAPENVIYDSTTGNLSWDSVEDATGYYIYRATTQDGVSESSYWRSTSSSSYGINLSLSTDYYYAVKAYNSNDVSELSPVVKVEKATAPVASYANGQLSWTSISDVTYYVYKGTSAEDVQGQAVSAYVTTTAGTSCSVTLSATDDYYYAVRAYSYSEGAYSGLSNVVKVEKVDVVTANPATWQLVTVGTYAFTKDESTNVWTSNNAGINSSSATATWAIGVSSDGVAIEIPYTVSSESNYDKLTLTLDDAVIVNGVSGTVSSTYTGTLSEGVHTLTATYSKDGSNNNGTDTATVTLNSVSY